MSVDTRTPRFDDQPALSMTKVDSDPAQVIVNHASFRVQLAPGQRTRLRPVAPAGPVRIPAMSGAPGRRRAPVVWSGRSAPGDPGATGLLQAVRNSTAGRLDTAPADGFGADHGDSQVGATQVIPLLEETQPNPVLVAPHQPGGGRTGPLLPPMRRAVGAYDSVEPAVSGSGEPPYDEDPEDEVTVGDRRQTGDTVRHAYYPGRRMNLGVVLLPLRVLIGFISIYAGMGKLCDPVYFDDGDRGSMVRWLTSLHPWSVAEPVRDFALTHPVGTGLSVAFLQVVVGVLTVLGLWQRIAAAFGLLLAAALLVAVSWRSGAAYDASDIIFLAAWSPLVIAGAPVYSLDGRLAGEAWRTLGPRSAIWDLRRRVLRRGAAVATVVVGLTLLVGSMLGGAVRSTEVVTVPGPNGNPTNQLPGSPLPDETTGKREKPSRSPEQRRPEVTPSTAPTTPSADASTPGTGSAPESGRTAGASTGQPSQTQGTGQEPPQETTPQEPPAGSAGPTSSGGTSSGGSGGGSDDGGDPEEGSTGGAGQNPIGGLLG
ncbi:MULTISPECIES: DoxX family membrane protein [unclassified Streptomyces]|uniref:DoxX family membrane protein n=1 Tax=Streptomyces TaxID=1883 RepID=UPI0001C1C48E|nr:MULTISPECIES: DoxX family membrane protein [unclassified Streptomyces]AEN11532.1 DoxX family protein [Streptomyces sp. SirexAA-E]MYR67447.1 DoxX family membrane protein [Streptomyces sp. SID4939]MYS01333.1 DoxX family membrane protein [Streptomyces sp. SID4940]MYT61946.1 DoxX family membrane protein [Streptomyces sp. SID8357]MYT85316.1 DoxX family membrane protein [Streptomyces sp. SID8360]